MPQDSSVMRAMDEERTARSVQLVYGLYALNLAVPGPFGLIGVIIAYMQRDAAYGTWLASHFTWQIRTFWLGILYIVIGIVTIPIIVGIVILCLIWVWSLIRTVMGWSAVSKGRPMTNPDSWLF